MSTEVNAFQLALNQAEQKIAIIDAESARMTAELERLAVEKAVLVGTRKALRKQLGEVIPEEVNDEEGSSIVPRNYFRGIGPAEAARKYLQLLGHGCSHADMVQALLRGKVRSGSKRPADSFRTSIQRRSDWFRWKKEKGKVGKWELVEWPGIDETSKEPSRPATSPILALVGQRESSVQS